MGSLHGVPRRYLVLQASEAELMDELKGLKLDKSQPVLLALRGAKACHGSELRDTGGPYLENHIYPVTIEALRSAEAYGMDLGRVAQVALLHDVRENNPRLTRGALRHSFGDDVSGDVESLTKVPLEEPHLKDRRLHRNLQMARDLGEASSVALLVKAHDRMHNLLTPADYSAKPRKTPAEQSSTRTLSSNLDATLEYVHPHVAERLPEMGKWMMRVVMAQKKKIGKSKSP